MFSQISKTGDLKIVGAEYYLEIREVKFFNNRNKTQESGSNDFQYLELTAL